MFRAKALCHAYYSNQEQQRSLATRLLIQMSTFKWGTVEQKEHLIKNRSSGWNQTYAGALRHVFISTRYYDTLILQKLSNMERSARKKFWTF